jgi:hypothetical protein
MLFYMMDYFYMMYAICRGNVIYSICWRWYMLFLYDVQYMMYEGVMYAMLYDGDDVCYSI